MLGSPNATATSAGDRLALFRSPFPLILCQALVANLCFLAALLDLRVLHLFHAASSLPVTGKTSTSRLAACSSLPASFCSPRLRRSSLATAQSYKQRQHVRAGVHAANDPDELTV